MPRKAPSRTGPGGNRTDVGLPGLQAEAPGQPNGIPSQPIGVPTGLPYGEAGQLQQAQQAVPLPNAQPNFAQILQAAKTQVPGVDQRPVTPLDAPSERPGEHVLTGAMPPYGIGQPVAAPQGMAGGQPGAISDMLTQIAQKSGSPAIAALAQNAKALGQ